MASLHNEESLDTPNHTVLSPSKLAHVVLRTGRFAKMTEFYKSFLGAKPAYENDFISFLSYDDEHHRIAIIAFPNMPPVNTANAGLEHIAFAFDTLHDLLLAYQQRKVKGITPFWCVNHGPTTSIYYQDPDGNQLETQVDNFDSPEAANAFMSSEEFRMNPIGTDFDPEEVIKRLKAGVDESVIKKRVEIGSRNMESVPRPDIPVF